MRVILRALSLAALVAAVALAVFDTIESVATSAVDLTSLEDVWTRYGAQTLVATEQGLGKLPLSAYLVSGLHWVLAQPAFGVALALSLLAWFAGYKKTPAAGRFAA